jgi:transcriptional regulator with XRE-family HTH domain
MTLPAAAGAVQPEPTLSKAVVRAARLLAVSQAELASVLGVSRATASRLFASRYLLSPSHGKEWELGLLFVRLFRSLDAVAGHGDEARAWLRGENRALAGRPIELMASAEGLVRVIGYLDSVRGRV